MTEPVVLLESFAPNQESRSFAFEGLVEKLVAHRPEEVADLLAEVEKGIGKGLHAAGFLAYEAASGLDPVLETREPGELPLAWFGIFRNRVEVKAGNYRLAGAARSREGNGTYSLSEWKPSIARCAYDEGMRWIREHIAAGDTYQVNYTLRLRADFSGDYWAFYRDLCRAQRGGFCAYLDLGETCILSASPELFFSLRDDRLVARPMKGTRPRGRWLEEDKQLAEELYSSAKDRAENVMIVDLLRNDLGRVSEIGSVVVPQLWEEECYETVWQLTSTVEGHLREGIGLPEIFRALFPCGSVTGAPKVRTMQIISEVEDSPRGVYTGCIGFVSPGPEAVFSVAIRTVCIDREQNRAEFGVGGGITWGSSAEGEYEECLVKAQVLRERRPEFRLLETMLFAADKGYYLLDRHLARLGESAAYFGFACDADEVEKKLNLFCREFEGEQRIRLLLDRDGEIELQNAPLGESGWKEPLRAALADEPIDSRDPFLYHKTTHREVYERRQEGRQDCGDVILHNERGEVTECCLGNLVALIDGCYWTPPIESGLLNGTFRAELLERGEIREKILKIKDLYISKRLFLINSVRRWVELELERTGVIPT
jgi:para-aminobenzoate synthetase / 4-amino-4-deoxychorismate lyase